jgi:hypothetical protein
MASATHAQLTTLIISPSDLKKARRELETLDDFLHQAGLRASGSTGKPVKLPQTSRLIEELVSEANANLLRAPDRAALLKYLTTLIEKAPVLHISFASEPSAPFMGKLIVWLRGNIHPQVLVHVGLQPSVVAGCIVRTANKQFDMSLKQAFEDQRQVLIDDLRVDPSKVTAKEAAEIEAETLKAVQAAAVAKEQSA